MSEGEISRRDFIKRVAFTLGSLFVPKQLDVLREQTDKDLLGDYRASGNEVFKLQEAAVEGFSLPENKTNTRQWSEIVSELAPPSGFRQAATWSIQRESFIIHGGWGEGGNSNQTWELKNGQWKKLEENSTPKLSGHKMVETPLGIFMFGGMEDVNGSGVVSNKGYLLEEKNGVFAWQRVDFDLTNGDEPTERQGMGMVYDKTGNTIWLIAGANAGGITSDIAKIRLPDEGSNTWKFQKVDQGGDQLLLFEPLVFYGEENNQIYVYGGLKQYVDRRIDSRDAYIVRHETSGNASSIQVTQADWPLCDYAGPVRGGYDPKRKQVVLSGGATPNFFQTNWDKSVMYDTNEKLWYAVDSANQPRYLHKSATSLNPQTGEILQFGGVWYESGKPIFSNQTWNLKPVEKVYLPFITK